MSDCKLYRREIEGAADGGALGDGARAHAAVCRACACELRERERLRALVGGLSKVEAPADFEFRLRARMAAAKGAEDGGRFGGRWLYGFAPVAVAACFVVVSATLYFRQSPRAVAPGARASASVPSHDAEPGQVAHVDNPRVVNVESSSEGKPTVALKSAGAPAVKVYKAVRSPNARAAQAREVALRNERRAEAATNTLVSSVTGARVLTLPLKSSAEPLRVILRDERGAERVVPMRSVSFGSQSLLTRDASLKQAGASEVGGVW